VGLDICISALGRRGAGAQPPFQPTFGAEADAGTWLNSTLSIIWKTDLDVAGADCNRLAGYLAAGRKGACKGVAAG